MEEIFKNSLRILHNEVKPQTFKDAVIGFQDWALVERADFTPSGPQISEKSLVVDSFSRFAQEKIQESPTKSFGFPGGVILEKAPDNSLTWKKRYQSKQEFLEAFINNLPQEMKDLSKSKMNAPIKMIVLTESRLPLIERVESALPLEYQLYFKQDVGELLYKMIEALKITHIDYFIFSTSEFSQDDLFELIYWVQPQVVVPLGASSTRKVMNTQDKLSQIHGKLTLVPLEDQVVKMIALFHPSVLVGNVNMKKTTWADMQEIIKILHL